MKLSRNGQVSIPAATRARWQSDRVVVVDVGDHLVMRPATVDPIESIVGKYADDGPTADEMRRSDRKEARGRRS